MLKEKDTISKDKLVSQVIAKTPERYMPNFKKVIDDKGDAITIDDHEKEILRMYELSNIHSGADSDGSTDEAETAMITFEGKCYNFGEKGHRANVCPKKKEADKDEEKPSYWVLWQVPRMRPSWS